MLGQLIAEYDEAIFGTDRDRTLKIVHGAEMMEVSPEDIVFKAVLPAVDLMINSNSENLDANLAQHFVTAQIADAVTSEMISRFKTAPEITGRVVIGTAFGDMRSLGKRIVMECLRARMVDVRDLGVNV
jgi:methanogenic corrinoid protein MtbC1